METRRNNDGLRLPEGEWVRVIEVSDRLRAAGLSASRTAIREWIKKGHVRGVRLMKKWYVNWDDVMRVVKKSWEV